MNRTQLPAEPRSVQKANSYQYQSMKLTLLPLIRSHFSSLLSPLFLIPIFLSSSVVAAEVAHTPPNIIIILIDDMGYADIGPFGATKQRTPQLDRMAQEGMKLTSFYAAPVCSVSRAQVMTGCYGVRVSVPGVFFPAGKNGLNPSEVTVAERLKERGYATMCIGKWHLGDQLEFLPTRQGFDHYLGLPYSNDMQRKAKDGTQTVPLIRDEQVEALLSNEQQSTLVQRYTDEAISFIKAHQQKPFFLYLPHTAIHTPIHPSAEFSGKSANGSVGDWIEELDASTGRILETLRELKLSKKTLVIFTSDNGPWLSQGKNSGSALPLRGGKGSTWEGGMREPTIAWWPGRIAAGKVCDIVAGTIDLLPTCVALAGGQLPAEPVIDGKDISPLLFGTATQATREAHYYFSGSALQAVRQGPWKLAIVPQNEAMGSKVPPDASGTNPRLYDLDHDIGERTDVADKHPDIVERLQALAKRMDAELGSKGTARRPAGVATNPKLLYPVEEKAKDKAKK